LGKLKPTNGRDLLAHFYRHRVKTITERESTKFSRMFGSGPDLEMHVQNLGVPSVKTVLKLLFFRWL